MSDIATAGTFRLAGVFSKAFSIYGRRIVPFIIIAVLGQIPNYILLFTLGATPRVGEDTAITIFRVGILQLNVVTAFLAMGAMAYGVIQEFRGQTFSVGDSIVAALRRILPVLGFLLIYYAVVIVGGGVLGAGAAAIALGLGHASPTLVVAIVVAVAVIPISVAVCMFFLVMPVCVVEKAGVFTSMSRSRFLTKGHRWQVFGTFLLIGGASFGLMAILSVASGRGFVEVASGAGPLIGVTIAYYVLGTFISAFFGVVTGVFYYDLRVAKEGVDINKIGGVFD